jgi:hypothetical protein
MSGGLDEFFVLIGENTGVVEFTSWSDLDLAESMEAGICTVRGRSLPLEGIFGVPMDRERVSPVWASMRCRESSGFGSLA